jgi:hypothetical protein
MSLLKQLAQLKVQLKNDQEQTISILSTVKIAKMIIVLKVLGHNCMMFG